MLEIFEACICQFFLGLWDVMSGILYIYKIDKLIELQRAEDNRRFQESMQARERHFAGRRHASSLSYKNICKKRPPRMIRQVCKTSTFSSCIWIAIWLFTKVLLPGLFLMLRMSVIVYLSFPVMDMEADGLWIWILWVANYLFTLFFVIPMYSISKIVSSFWFQEVAYSVFKHYYGEPKAFPTVGAAIADTLHNLVIETIFLAQASIARCFPMPFVGSFLYIIHICLLYSLYAQEYKWFMMGLALQKRLQLIDSNWPYFVGFGFPLFIATHVVTSSYSFYVSACVFSMVFPFVLFSGIRSSAPAQNVVCKLRIFEPTLAVGDFLFRVSLRIRRNS